MDPRAGTDYSHGQAGASSRHVPPEDAAAGLAPPSAEELGNQDNGAGDGAAGEARQGDESVGGALAMLSGYDTDDSSGQD